MIDIAVNLASFALGVFLYLISPLGWNRIAEIRRLKVELANLYESKRVRESHLLRALTETRGENICYPVHNGVEWKTTIAVPRQEEPKEE